MDKEIWEIWLENEKRREFDFQRYLRLKQIKEETELKDLIEGHIEKADHNLKFVKSTLELKEFNDWAIVSAYYFQKLKLHTLVCSSFEKPKNKGLSQTTPFRGWCPIVFLILFTMLLLLYVP